jgi:hypothetical protein
MDYSRICGAGRRAKCSLEKKERAFMSETEQEEQSSPIINIPIEWPIPDSLQSQYASAVFVQAGPYEIAISFFEARPPILTGAPEENRAKLEQLGPIKAKCVGRIIVDPDLVPKFIEALQAGLEGYRAYKRSEEREVK